jgi:hypothetical protein
MGNQLPNDRAGIAEDDNLNLVFPLMGKQSYTVFLDQGSATGDPRR